MKIPEVFQIEVEHTPGSLAKVLDMVGKAGLTIEGLEAVSRTRYPSGEVHLAGG